MSKRSLIEPAIERLPEKLRLLSSVAEKALALGKAPEAERLLSSSVSDFQALAEFASTDEERAEVARLRALLAPLLQKLEAATRKPWTRVLDARTHPAWWTRGRGQA